MEELKILSAEFKIREDLVGNIIKLIDDGNTIPFIARYRKEMTGSCDDQVLREFADRLQYLRNLQKRREEVCASIDEQGKLTEELKAAIDAAATLAEVEDLYRPYKPKRRTRATIAKEKGLEPLALRLFAQEKDGDLLVEAAEFVDAEKGVETAQDALAGASDIIAEMISDDAGFRKDVKAKLMREGLLRSEAATEEDTVYRLYYEYEEPLRKIPSHRILAVNRGEKEEKLKVKIVCGDVSLMMESAFVRSGSYAADFVRTACADAWDRLIFPSVEREIRSDLFACASEQAIKMFGMNLKQLLMQPPIKGKVVLAVDPAYRTGCKIALVDPTGMVLDTGVIYPTPPQNKTAEAAAKMLQWIEKYQVDCISIGNGTASKEAEIFVADTIKKASRKVTYMVVSESGASVYSASKLAAEEFPQFDVSLRSAVSIARRLQDPLAELVKIDPKAIGVGQYQHDMPPARLDETLTGVVEDCVNSVGVDLNTASPSLLSYIAGINGGIAKNIVAYREQTGGFTNRKELLKVKKLGAKAYEQCAGFLRIPQGKEPLDNTSVHPESYPAAKKLLEILNLADASPETLCSEIVSRVDAYGRKAAAEACGVGLPTLNDMIPELARPGRDIRDDLPAPMLRSDVMDMSDLTEGMVLKGTVRNVIDFGAFVDIGVHQDGLVHISQLADRYVKHPSDVVKVGDVVEVRVLSVDVAKKRISLTMRKENK
ncbi:MAG: RNA-binding transcriptional accessory protein [Clostridia bacterium]|nr:RNA-binding transcriptional accessory protein [Clostridia bacterium]